LAFALTIVFSTLIRTDLGVVASRILATVDDPYEVALFTLLLRGTTNRAGHPLDSRWCSDAPRSFKSVDDAGTPTRRDRWNALPWDRLPAIAAG
jgi:hypothetical protein